MQIVTRRMFLGGAAASLILPHTANLKLEATELILKDDPLWPAEDEIRFDLISGGNVWESELCKLLINDDEVSKIAYNLPQKTVVFENKTHQIIPTEKVLCHTGFAYVREIDLPQYGTTRLEPGTTLTLIFEDPVVTIYY